MVASVNASSNISSVRNEGPVKKQYPVGGFSGYNVPHYLEQMKRSSLEKMKAVQKDSYARQLPVETTKEAAQRYKMGSFLPILIFFLWLTRFLLLVLVNITTSALS